MVRSVEMYLEIGKSINTRRCFSCILIKHHSFNLKLQYLEYQAKIEAKKDRKTTPPRRHLHEPKDKKPSQNH